MDLLSELKAHRDDRLDHLDAVEHDMYRELNTLKRLYGVNTHDINSLLKAMGDWFCAMNDVIEVENRIDEWKAIELAQKDL